VDRLSAAKSEGVGLIVHAISFQNSWARTRGSQLLAGYTVSQPAILPSTRLKRWELTSQPKRQYPADEKLTLTLSTTWMQAYVGTIVWKFGGDPVICQNCNPLDGEPETYFNAK